MSTNRRDGRNDQRVGERSRQTLETRIRASVDLAQAVARSSTAEVPGTKGVLDLRRVSL
ncbi:hypothetical protein [Candidatus Palauibacter sp.]|uniref:hypothetical protein n=1 Tax=Candidatus Palauibacter sp. TaxID=3101350 RepID=UPI003AF2B5C2